MQVRQRSAGSLLVRRATGTPPATPSTISGGKRPGRGPPPTLRSPTPPRVPGGAAVRQQSLAFRLCVPQGSYPKETPHRAAPGGPSSPRLFSACSPVARRHQAPPLNRRPILHRQAPTPDAPVCTPPSGWARVRLRCWAQRAAQFWVIGRYLAVISCVRSAPGRTGPPGGRPRGRGRAREAPPVSAAHLHCCSESGSLSVQRVSAPPVDTAAASLQSRAAPVTRVSALGVRPQLRSALRPQRLCHSSLSARPPASARPGTNLKSGPPEPIS
ncbi:hypothetical protein NDU88_005449 [Pleurodeles waltl]|uniref:Uncharacterized protein n=1 Tax=Pleurodeles waltl TaxID=8319 RepID=A0AAV7SLP4_PLEWA|nr:hypothetical protein NDU88_005449 [Pleurodeles waltl]